MLKYLHSLNTRCMLTSLCLVIAINFSANSRALEVLTLHELVVHCKHLDAKPASVDGQYCLRYIQGFIDGAIETDIRVLKDLNDKSKSGITDRAMKTRLPRRAAYNRPGQLAGFCLDDPLPLRQVVNTVVADLIALDNGDKAGKVARIAVDDALRRHYACAE